MQLFVPGGVRFLIHSQDGGWRRYLLGFFPQRTTARKPSERTSSKPRLELQFQLTAFQASSPAEDDGSSLQGVGPDTDDDHPASAIVIETPTQVLSSARKEHENCTYIQYEEDSAHIAQR